MRRVTSFRLSRRSALRGLGVALTLPWLEAMAPVAQAAPSTFTPWKQSQGPQPRVIFCYVPNGVNIIEWVPQASGANYQLSPTLQSLAAHKNDFTIISGMGHPHSEGGHSGADTWLTGANLKGVPGADYTNTVSIDQVIAETQGKQTRFASLQLSDNSGAGGAGHSHTLSFDRAGTPLPAENSPRRLFERLFVPDSKEDREATLRRYAERKSILDGVLQDAKRLQEQLGDPDRKKLDEYLSAVRQTEERIARLQAWIDIPKPEVEGTSLQLDSQPGDAHDRPMWLDVMLELCYLAFATDTTRVIAFEWSREAGGYGGAGENHHELSHHGGDPGMLAKLAAIDRFHLDRLARWMDLLKNTQDGDARMLDRTAIVYGSGMNSGLGGEHSPKNLPLLVAGGGQLGFKHGKHVAYDADQSPPLCNVLLTVAQRLGVETDRFQDSTSTTRELLD